MRKIVVSITLAILLMSCIGYAQPRDGRDSRQPPPIPPPKHRSDQVNHSPSQPDGDKHTQPRTESGRSDRETRSQNQSPPQSRPDRNDRVQPPPDRAERPQVQPPPNQPLPNNVQNQFPPNNRGNLMPPVLPGPNPVTPAPNFPNSPGSDGSYIENSNSNGGQKLNDIVSIVDQFLNFSSLFH